MCGAKYQGVSHATVAMTNEHRDIVEPARSRKLTSVTSIAFTHMTWKIIRSKHMLRGTKLWRLWYLYGGLN